METYQLIKFEDVCIHHDLDTGFVETIKTFEIINFIVKDNVHYIAIDDMPVIERVIRLHYDLQINMEGIAVINRMRSKIENLQETIQKLQNKLAVYQ